LHEERDLVIADVVAALSRPVRSAG
jgi:hypothetical protein